MTSAAADRFETEYRRRRAQALLWRTVVAIAMGVAFYYAAVIAQFSPEKLVEGWPKMGKFFEEFFPTFKWNLIDRDADTEGSFAYWMYAWRTWSWALLQSVNMAVLATIASVTSGFAIAVVAARNMGLPVWLSFAAQRFGDLLRTLPDLVLALVFVVAFGIGPFAGLLAIWLHATGALTKLYSEVVENIDMSQIEGLRGAGATWLQRVRYGVIPQVLPNVASYGLLRFEINVGAAAAIGFVGGGGIGQEFVSAMQAGYLKEASAILAMIIVVIFMIDLLSERIRHRLIGNI